MKVSEKLRAAKTLIEKPEKWNRYWYALDRQGRGINLYQDGLSPREDIASYCALGAVMAIDKNDVRPEDFLTKAAQVVGREFPGIAGGDSHVFRIAEVNDCPEVQHADILRMYDIAIELAEKEENNA